MDVLNPTGDQFRDMKKNQKPGPFVMVNLLRFSSSGRMDGETGKESYERYGQTMGALLKKAGGRLLWIGNVDQVFIGTAGDGFDYVMLVEYPSRKAFLEMVSSPEYLEANRDREAGLQRAVLLTADTVFSRIEKI